MNAENRGIIKLIRVRKAIGVVNRITVQDFSKYFFSVELKHSFEMKVDVIHIRDHAKFRISLSWIYIEIARIYKINRNVRHLRTNICDELHFNHL